MYFIIKQTRRVLGTLDNVLERVESGLIRCGNCGKPMTPWQRVCGWCGYERW